MEEVSRRDNMKIKLERIGKGEYKADCLDLCGSPRCGFGTSREMALIHLFMTIIQDKQEKYIKMDEMIINNRKWKIPPSFLKNGR